MAKNTSDRRNFSGMKAIEKNPIYANVDDINLHNLCRRTDDSDTTRNESFHYTGSERVRIRSYRSVTVCLVLLCVLLLTAVIVLCVLINTNNQQFNIKTKNITEDRDQLLSKYTNITKERDELIAKYRIIPKKKKQLNQEKNELPTSLNDGWIYYQSSLYFISSEKKSWSESRRDCIERGADLIIINNKEEQDFIQKIQSGTECTWIGLTDSEEEGRWKWVDGSTLTTSFWNTGEPNGGTRENCTLKHFSHWADYSCNDAYKYICEKNIFK